MIMSNNAVGKLALACLALSAWSQVEAKPATYYVGLDTADGSNQGHLSLLRGHVNHFHRIGAFGGATGRLPEAYLGSWRLRLFPAAGDDLGRYVSRPYHDSSDPSSEYSDYPILPIASLLDDDSPEGQTLRDGVGSRYFGDLAGTDVALEVVSLSAGLHVRDGNGTVGSVPGDHLVLGSGDGYAAFTPTFFTDLGLAPGLNLSAVFKLVDRNGLVGESGLFAYEFQTQPVPEPTTLALAGMGAAGALVTAARRRASRRHGSRQFA